MQKKRKNKEQKSMKEKIKIIEKTSKVKVDSLQSLIKLMNL